MLIVQVFFAGSCVEELPQGPEKKRSGSLFAFLKIY
jgi:hypothetical protein